MTLRIKPSSLQGYYELCDEDGRDPSYDGIAIFGSMEEWLQIADAIEKGKSADFSRCAAYRRSHYWDFSCPRNSSSRDSGVSLFDGVEAAAFVDHVRATFPSGTYESNHGLRTLSHESVSP